MTTAPWSPAAAEALRGDLFHTLALEALPATGDPIPLDPVSGTVTFDDGWAPHVQASIVCAVPPAQATLDAVDPRAGVRLSVSAGYRYPGGPADTHTLALLELRTRTVARPGNTMRLEADSAECRLADLDPLGASHAYSAAARITDVITDVLSWALGVALVPAMSSTATLGEALTVTTGAELWDLVHDLADRVGGWLYVDGAGAWHLEPMPSTIGRSSHIMDVGPGGNLTETEASLSVEEWGNAVVLDYGSDLYGWAKVTTGPLAVGTVPTKAVTVPRRSTPPGTQAGRNTAAAAVLRRVLSRGRGFTLTGPAAYWLRPGHTVTARLPTGPQERHLASRVTFDLARGAMTVTTRVPDDATEIETGA